MVARKSQVEKKKTKTTSEEVKSKKVDPKWNVDLLPEAVQDGKFVGNVGDELVVVRMRDGRMQKSHCVVTGITGSNVDTFDNTRDQWFTFSTTGLEKYGIVVKMALRSEVSSSK